VTENYENDETTTQIEDANYIISLLLEAKDKFSDADRIAEKINIVLDNGYIGDYCCECDELIAEIERKIADNKEINSSPERHDD